MSVAIQAPVAGSEAVLWQFVGTGADDARPMWKQQPAPAAEASAVHGLSCPSVSASVLSLSQ